MGRREYIIVRLKEHTCIGILRKFPGQSDLGGHYENNYDQNVKKSNYFPTHIWGWIFVKLVFLDEMFVLDFLIIYR